MIALKRQIFNWRTLVNFLKYFRFIHYDHDYCQDILPFSINRIKCKSIMK